MHDDKTFGELDPQSKDLDLGPITPLKFCNFYVATSVAFDVLRSIK